MHSEDCRINAGNSTAPPSVCNESRTPRTRACGEMIEQRITHTKMWLVRMNKRMRKNEKKRSFERESAALLFSALRASSALLTEGTSERRPLRRGRHRPRRYCCALISFLDGTPFMTPQDLCRYNTAVAEGLSDDQLELVRLHVFDYDEDAFAELLYADDVIQEEEMKKEQRAPYSSAVEAPRSVQLFNEKSRWAMERLFAAPGGLVDAVIRSAQNVPTTVDDMDDDGVGSWEDNSVST
ncbi:hypothetical protein ERJ75_000990300 [Trypanosoma vivax]|uniref:Uncharacterized protein n=1 Tax=Trypanosoma vivax (strain Y486) TaxID=1055687 RepID=G0U702_TRYVY|nr:hypothetical protein TRVL_01108 [Trypanosoma vivax]KAH8611697.1 hypothetical protein ERJ75_000990300 [Trypanosoma vivax]CCC51659.1 conserved hypothetical protein [Trypanosoma vivax Y486]